MSDELERTEIEALLETRRELGPQYDAALVDSFADRIERAVAERTPSPRSSEAAGKRQLALGIVSVVAGIPVSAITLAVPDGAASLGALIVGWTGIVGVNAAHALQGRRRS